MKSASLKTSPRLRRTLDVLERAEGRLTTRDLVRRADICAVNSVIAELRANGCEIETKTGADSRGRRRWSYRLVSAPANWRDQ